MQSVIVHYQEIALKGRNRPWFVERLVSDGGTLDQLVELGDTLEELTPRLEEIAPRLEDIARVVPSLSDSAESLHRAVGPLSDLAARLPGGRRRPSLSQSS